jgi:DNA polymerase-3 subunit gamma/tau
VAYLAIARKYRPDRLSDIVGQEHVTRTLGNALRSGRVHHAYLFCGARGVGKTSAARAFARALSCAEGPRVDPCGACAVCREILAGTCPDLIEIDGASNNSVDDIRDLRDTVHYAPNHGRYRIYLVDEVHMLSKAAFNALLKTLEEPPPHVIFLFATTEPHKVLDTILSRVQRFDFKRIPAAEVARRLADIAAREGVQIGAGSLLRIARAGDGSMRDAQSLLDKAISFAGAEPVTDALVAEALGLVDRARLHRFVGGIVHARPDDALAVIDELCALGFEPAHLAADALDLLRDATFLRLSPEVARYADIADDDRAELAATVGDADPSHLARAFQALTDTVDALSRTPRPRAALEMAVARLATARPLVPLSGLIERLEALERGSRNQVAARSPAAPPAPRPMARPQDAPARPAPAVAPPVAPAPGSSVAEAPPPPTPPPPRPQAPPPVDAPSGAVADPPDVRGWTALAAAWRAIGPEAARLAEGRPSRVGDTLVLRIPEAATRLRARAALRLDAVRAAVATHIGPEVVLQVEGSDDTDAVKRALESDPRVQRVAEALHATPMGVRQRE